MGYHFILDGVEGIEGVRILHGERANFNRFGRKKAKGTRENDSISRVVRGVRGSKVAQSLEGGYR